MDWITPDDARKAAEQGYAEAQYMLGECYCYGMGVPKDGSEADVDGSWDPVGLWASYGGRAYATAMGALCLEVYYRYLPIHHMLNR